MSEHAKELSEATGTTECPICGFDQPHYHEHEVVEWHRTGRHPQHPDWPELNASQREQMKAIARGQWRIQQEREAFNRNPRAFLAGVETLIAKSYWLDAILMRMEQAEATLAAQGEALTQAQASGWQCDCGSREMRIDNGPHCSNCGATVFHRGPWVSR